MATKYQRAHIKGLCQWLIQSEKLIHYEQKRPMTTRTVTEQMLADLFALGQTISMDCSESGTLICRLAGLADPNGQGYNGWGYTGTMLAHLPHYSDSRKAAIGALVVFGPGTGEHVCTVMESGSDPLLFSHGQEKGPIAIRYSEEKRFHAPPATFLDVSHL